MQFLVDFFVGFKLGFASQIPSIAFDVFWLLPFDVMLG